MSEILQTERTVFNLIRAETVPSKLPASIRTTRRQSSRVVESAAFQRPWQVQPEATPGTIERYVWRSIRALGQMHREERGKTVRLSRTRQKIARDGEAKTASDPTLEPVASAGFSDLVARGYTELTFEAVVLRHPLSFDVDTRHSSKARPVAAGLDPARFAIPA